jgi:uncharacterized protein
MIDGRPVTDAHMHVPRLSTVSPAWMDWAVQYGKDEPWHDVFDTAGDPVPARLEALLDAQGVDTALLFAEYSPRATGTQPIEDLLPVIAHNPARFRLVANVNPEVHDPAVKEAERQLNEGAVALKIHPVHGAFRPDAPPLHDVYDLCSQRQIPVIVHTGPSIFPGSLPEAGDPNLLRDIIARFPGVQFVLAHGGRGGWYADAAGMALTTSNVWLDIAGLPPKRLPDYYRAFDLSELAARWIFGTDWPGVPGTKANVRALAALGLPGDVLDAVLGGNAHRVYGVLQPLDRRIGGRRQQPPQQHHLRVVQVGSDRYPPDMLPGERDGLLSQPELLAQPEVLLSEPVRRRPGRQRPDDLD